MTGKTICMWSGPRNLSTAMMRAFENRSDTEVWDEPFFAPWLKVTGKDHPGRTETLAQHENDAVEVARLCLEWPLQNHGVHFQKHMAHHLLDDFPFAWTKSCQHFFLIRRPDAVIASYAKGRSQFDVDDIGFWPQIRLYEKLTKAGHAVPIVDCDDILQDPPAVLSQLCRALRIPFEPSMLAWPPGARASDGAWAPWWYQSVEASTGFVPPRNTPPDVPPEYQPMLDEVWPAYDSLFQMRTK